MGLQLGFAGTLTAGPASSSDSSFPSSVVTEPFELNPAIFSYNVSTGVCVVLVNSSNAFETLPGIGGAVGPVTQATFVYVRAVIPFQIRVTYQGDGVAKVHYTNGIWAAQVDPSHPITLLEVQGAGQFTYFAVGNQ
jgi:hypothetical protein